MAKKTELVGGRRAGKAKLVVGPKTHTIVKVARDGELKAVIEELVAAIHAVRDGMRKEALEALPPAARMAVDLALLHAKRLGAKGLETESAK